MKKIIKILSILVVFVFLFQSFSFENKAVADTAVNLKKGKALIVVNYDKEKILYEGLVLREENFDFQIDIVSLEENKIKKDPQLIHNFLWKQKEKYNFFVLDENIAYGPFQGGASLSDYYYAFPTDYNTAENFFPYDKEGAEEFGCTVEHYPETIISRIKRNQITFYSNPKKKLAQIEGVFGLTPVFHNRTAIACGIGSWHTELSYTGDLLKNKIIKKNNSISITTMYEIRSKYVLRGIDSRNSKVKPVKKPNIPLTKENFEKVSKNKNFFLLFNTAEPVPNEDDVVLYRQDLTTSYWIDSNKDGNAQNSEITVETIVSFSKFNNNEVFSFVMAPMPYKIDEINVPFLIVQQFDFFEEPRPRPYMDYFIGNDPEESSASTFWNGILSNIASGMTFAEATLLGYTAYFKVINPRDKDDFHQAFNATRLVFFGLPWYNIKDLVKQPEIQLEASSYLTMGAEIKIPVKNTGDENLIVRVKEQKETEYVSSIIVKPEETKELVIKKKPSQMFNLGTNRLPRKSIIMVNLMTNDTKHPNIQLKIEFWE